MLIILIRCMVDFVRPNFLGTRTEFGNMFERPIQNGQCVDSSPGDVKLMKERVYVLHSLVKGFVQRRSHAVLRNTLPQKEEHVLLLRLTPLQRALYRHHMSDLVQNKSVSNPLKAFAICLKIWNHPDVLYNFVKRCMDDDDLDLLDDDVTESNRKKPKKNSRRSAVTSSASASVASPAQLAPSVSTSLAPGATSTDDETVDGVRIMDPSNTSATGSFASHGANPTAKEKKDESMTTLEWANEMLKGTTSRWNFIARKIVLLDSSTHSFCRLPPWRCRERCQDANLLHHSRGVCSSVGPASRFQSVTVHAQPSRRVPTAALHSRY